MTCRLLGRCARLLSRASTQAAAAQLGLPVPLVRPADLLWVQSWPLPPRRQLCDSSSVAPQKDYVYVPKRTQLDELLEKVTTPEEVLTAWAEHGGNANHAALAIVKVARLVQGMKDVSQTNYSTLLMDCRFQGMLSTMVEQISLVWNGALVSALRAIGSLGVPSSDPSIASVQTEVLWRIRRLSYKQLAFLVDWGAGMKGQQEVAIVNSAMKQLELRWTEISDTKTVTTLISKGEHLPPVLMDRLEDKALELAEGFTAEAISRVCVAVASQSRRSVPLLRALSYHILQKPSSELTTPLLLDMAYAYGKLNFHHSQVCQRMALELLPRVTELSPADVTRCAKSFGFLKWMHLPLFEAFSEHYILNHQKYSTLQLCNLLMTLARLGFQPSKTEEFYSKAHAALEGPLLGLEVFLQTDVVWSLCILQQAKPQYLYPLTQPSHISKLLEGSPSRAENYRLKLLHIATTLQLEHLGASEVVSLPPSLTSPSTQARNSSLSPLQSTLRVGLQSLVGGRAEAVRTGVDTLYGWTLEGELVVDSENKPMDLVTFTAPHLASGGGDQPLPAGARRLAFIALEFPNFVSRSKDPLGRFAMRKRHLQLAGFITVAVPYYEWLELKSDWQKSAYLKDKMGKAVAEEMAK